MSTSVENPTQSWGVLAGHLDRFIAAWDLGDDPPTICQFLPADGGALRGLALVELIKIDMEERGRRRLPVRLEDYLEEHPELAEGDGPPCDLIYEEFHLRRARGEVVAAEEYFRRFPAHAAQLRRLLDIGEATVSTSLVNGRPETNDLTPGDQIDDFQLLGILGKGAFASVYLARQLSMQRLVALKISADKGDEPQLLGQLDHPNIVRVYDVRRLVDRRLRLLYMQYVAGGTLQAVIDRARTVPPNERKGKLIVEAVDRAVESSGHTLIGDSVERRRLALASWPEAVCRVGAQLAHALAYAHDRELLHRDVKPANVLLSHDGSPRLADFNISFSGQLTGATPAAYFGGSLSYMSPEQLEACNPKHERQPDELDRRSDIYSLGVVLWELLHGQRPYRDELAASGWSDTLAAMAARRRQGPPEASDSPADECWAQLEAVLRKCMAPNPDDRPSDGETLERELRLCLHPRAQKLLKIPGGGWRRAARRWPILAVLLVCLVPNALAGVFNYSYNEIKIVRRLTVEQQKFWNRQAAVINGVTFPAGCLCVLYFLAPIARALKRPESARGDPAHLAWLRRRTLQLGRLAVWVGVTLWAIAGVVYPLTLHFMTTGLSFADMVHFVGSLVVCGLIAAAYPYFGVTLLAVRVFYPALLAITPGDPQDEVQLHQVSQRAGSYLPVAGGVPMLALLLLYWVGGADETSARPIFAVLAAVGVGGLFMSYALFRMIQADLSALIRALAPPDTFGAGSETV